MANEFKVKNGIITPTLQSTVATGTSPLTVASTTLVSNLNADLLDGNHASAFYLATNPNGYTSNTGTVTSVVAGTYLTGGTINTSGTLAVDATSTNEASKIVARDTNGGFSAGVIQATDFNSTSDIRYKTNIATISSAVDKVLKLRGVSFNWKDSGKPSLGLIAQELEQVIPESVHDSGDKKTVSYGSLVGLLIEAIKEQQQQIDTLQRQLDLPSSIRRNEDGN